MDRMNVSRPLALLYRVFLFGRFRIEQRNAQGVYQPLYPNRWDRQSPQRVIAYLLVTPGRHALRDVLLEALCPDENLEKAQAILTQALSLVRCTLVDEQGFPLLLPRKANQQKPLSLAGREQIWCDWDAFQDKLNRAQVEEQQGGDALPLWEEAYALCQEEFLLAERYSDWCRSVRERTEGDQRFCLLHLATCYRKSGRSADAERILRSYLSAHTLDQDVLGCLMETLAEHGCIQEALNWYQRVKEALEEEGMEVAERTQDLAQWLQTPLRLPHYGPLDYEQRSLGVSRSFGSDVHTPFPSLEVFSSPPISSLGGSYPSPLTTAQDIIGKGDWNTPEEKNLDKLRRQIVGQAIKGTGSAIVMLHDATFHSEIAERLAKALTKSSYIDERTLLYLEKRIEDYWQDRYDGTLPVEDLLSYVFADLQKVTALLEGSLSPTMRTRLCSIAGTAAMLVGELYYDMRRYAQSRIYQELAIAAAHEAENRALEAASWGRNSFAWTYEGNPAAALNSVQQARHLTGHINKTICTWLAAIEAEIQSNLGNREACLKALKSASLKEETDHSGCYWIHFDRSLFAGYQGISFLNLSYKGHKDLVPEAQQALQDALNLLDPPLKIRQPILLIDLAGTYVQQQNIEQACGCAIQAITLTRQIDSKVTFQRLHTLRSHLEPWQDTHYVQDFDRWSESLLHSKKQQE